MYGKMKKKRKPASMTKMMKKGGLEAVKKKMYKGGGMEGGMGGVMDMIMKKGGVETRSVKRPSACMMKRKK